MGVETILVFVMNNQPSTRRTPSDAVLEHAAVIDKLWPQIRAKIQKEKVEAVQGKSVWADAGSISHTRELVQQIADFYGIKD